MDMRSIFRNPGMIRDSGDGEAKHLRTDGIVRLTVKSYAAAETQLMKPESTQGACTER